MKFKLRDRVRRRIDVFDQKSKMHYGRIARIYSYDGYPELYSVEWDDGCPMSIDGYLPHGLEPAVDAPQE